MNSNMSQIRLKDIEHVYDWLVVWNILYVSIDWGYSSHLTNIFQKLLGPDTFQ